MKRTLIVVVAVLVVAGAAVGGWKLWSKRGESKQYRTAKVERGSLIQTVRATGTVNPTTLVQVGTQVNGPVRKLYVDYNSRVKEGDLVAQIDPTVYEARLAQDEANLTQSMASVEQTQAKLVEAQKALERATKLAERQMISQGDLDTATANCDTLKAQLKVANAAVEQSKASLRLSKANLDYTTIRSPVDGVVIARNVDEGQTVVASMSAQVIFQIATDLRVMQVTASIPEADIGKIQIGQTVTFTVDAYDQSFTGTVSQIRMAAATVQNVVTYPVVINAANPDAKLFPGMTANIVCEVERKEDVLKLPNAALRFKPDDATAAKSDSSGAKAPQGDKQSRGPRKSKVWIQEKPGADLKSVSVATGITDGSFTELKESKGPCELAEGQSVITGVLAAGEKQAAVENPFVTKMPGAGGRGMR
jgi:HlyD family secretion protein